MSATGHLRELRVFEIPWTQDDTAIAPLLQELRGVLHHPVSKLKVELHAPSAGCESCCKFLEPRQSLFRRLRPATRISRGEGVQE